MLENFNERPHKNEKQESIAYVKALIEQARNDAREDDIPKLEKLIELLNSKKYGLVWERHEEIVEEEMKTKIPVFVEDESKKIQDNPDSEDYNFLLEGDNLHSLHLLEKTHTGKIDVIYIDPPYNTGNKDFKYNDKFVDNTDTFSHSKWLSFMERRLRIAYKLLSESGLIFVSISDIENAHLRTLLDDVFGEDNFVANLIWANREGGGSSDSKNFRIKHEYILSFAKRKENIEIHGVPVGNEDRYKQEDEFRGKYYLQKLGMGSIQYSSSLDYPITCPDSSIVMPADNNGGKKACWRWSKGKLEWGIQNHYIEIKKDRSGIWTVYTKQYLNFDNEGNKIERTQRPDGIIDNFSSTQGAKSLISIFGKPVFNYSKDPNLIKYLVARINKKNLNILDFFAGSGTTGQAVTELNAEDGGNRKFILATNNENNIAEEVTYERMKRVSAGTEKYTAHPMNLKYFKTDFVVKKDFPDASLEYELLKYVTPLVELEFAIDITNPKVQIVLNEEQLESLIANDELVSNSTLFMHPDVFRDAEQNQILSDLQIKVQEIPDYFFGGEMWQ